MSSSLGASLYLNAWAACVPVDDSFESFRDERSDAV